MEVFHLDFNRVFSLLLLKEREVKIASTMEDTTDMMAKAIFNEEFKAKTVPLVSFSTMLENSMNLKAD